MYCEYCGTKLTECTFGDTPEERLGCDNNECPQWKAMQKNITPSPDGYPKDSSDYVNAPKLFDAKTGEKL